MGAVLDPRVVEYWAGWVVVGLLVLILALLLGLLGLRLDRRWREPRMQQMRQTYRAHLMQVALGDLEPTSWPLPDADARWLYTRLWLHLQLSLRGAATDRLRRLGLACGLERTALSQMDSPHYAKRMIAMLTLGYLQWPAATVLLQKRLEQGHSHSAIYAARALLEMDAEVHAGQVVQALLHKPELDLSLVAVMLKPHRTVLQSAMLEIQPGRDCPNGSAGSDPALLVQWLRLARALQLQLPRAWLVPLLTETQEIESLIAAIRLFQGEAGIEPVLRLAQHPDWRVRAQVARSLAYVGGVDQADALVDMTTDREWWVRFRSAQALFQLPGLTVSSIMERVSATGDRYAIQMVQAVHAAQGEA